MAVETDSDAPTDFGADRVLSYVRAAVYVVAALIGLSLLVVGTVAIIAGLKGTWHWSIHLESTIRYMSTLVSYLLTALVPLFGILVVGRWYDG
ncbi:hypothetical protein KY092_00080 [Natronomonas gomsonensis]|jgi:hypothetical protein|uniref:hypothetical protein n=1 Tax=Natronomonas gomsonensis TaxID=1046043 RepID=UPI0020CA74E7|nr:hypothetical protein [Natronomonas gomsonensis]MCY4728949.1 hypothetical protein [Natronomonas gomsonensis]